MVSFNLTHRWIRKLLFRADQCDGVDLSVATKCDSKYVCDDASMDFLDRISAKDYRGSGRAVGTITDSH